MALGKMVVLKPVVWNDNGYTWPAGFVAGEGYSQEHGYGHEEWNGRSDWIWNGWKVFHTQGDGKMNDYSAVGRLGIIMTAMREGKFYAVGAACNVFRNDATDNASIVDELGLRDYTDDLWEVPAIRDRKANRSALEKHWAAHMHVNWRCPQTHYAWFAKPIQIVPNDLIPAPKGEPPRQAIVKMHGRFQAIRPDQALAVVTRALAPSHPIVGWLSTDDFDPVWNASVKKAPPPKGGGKRSASTTTDAVVRYMLEYEVVVSPRHHLLQGDFASYLQASDARDMEANFDRVDLRYKDKSRGPVLVEIKPTEPASIRFAIRAAMGQLLDYRQHLGGDWNMLVVIDDEPKPDDAALALTNGFGIAWRNGSGFTCRWP